MEYRKGKLDASKLLHPRVIDGGKFLATVSPLLGTDADREALARFVDGGEDEALDDDV